MEAILPFKIKNEPKFFENALKVGYNEMEILKFIYVMQQSDMDIFPIMHDERVNMLLYGWELCEDYKQKLNPNEWELPEEIETVLKLLVPWSMDIWFSKEWDKCKYFLKTALIHCLNRARDLLMRMPDMMQINWDFLLLYNLKPWNVLYLKNLTVTKDKTLENGAQSIESEELPATDEDIAYVKLEQLPIIVLRLVKFFDQSSIDMVKTLCMRVIAAWNKIHQTELETSGSRRPYIPPEDKRCLLLICHIYLMAVYESDDVKGYVIDNMINNVRFYYQGFQNSTPFHVMDNFEYTPARYIALTNFHLRVQKRDFFDFFIWNKYDTSLVNLFGVVSQAYKSYLLGNLLMELNNMNEDDFASNIPLYKRLMNSYVNEREKSEIFLLNELTKLEHQRYAHNIIQTVKNITDYESKICKGNRMSNIGNYENSDDTVAPLADTKAKDNSAEIKIEEFKEEVIDEDVELEQKRVKESELRLDPVFQNLPNNESMLYYVYDVLAKKDYKGWHFAKVVLLVKLIGHEQNMIETWRYHPGLTTDFMLNLEEKLSHHYVDLAKIFKDHPFLEQEFWLTAFYLNPISELYEIIKRLGMRNNRKRTDEQTKLVMSIDNVDAKYGLLSSTIDVKELATMSNTDDPITDYDPLFSALHSLKVPDSLIKDMLTAIFLPRNRSFAWAVDWVVLRNRCKMIMTSSKEKKRFVDLNMAEANERLKYLIIDYEKYKNRPQLDYGTIEQGYENLMAGGEFDKDTSEEEEDEEEEDFEDDEDVYESKKRGRGRVSAAARKKEEEEKPEDDNSQEDDPFLMGKRRTRARTAATLASFLFQTLPRSSRRKKNPKTEDEKVSGENDDRSSDSKSPITISDTPTLFPYTGSCDQKANSDINVPTKNLKECLKERPTFLNTTEGFRDLIDIWNVEKIDLQSIDENCVSLMESSTAIQIAVKLKLLNKEINPISCDEKEYIDETEMLIHNADYAIKKECEVDNWEENVKGCRKQYSEKNTIKGVESTGNGDIHIRKFTASDFKLPDDLAVEKVSDNRHRTGDINHIQDLIQAEENSNESLNSDLSMAARKDSSEVSETNTAANSKRNSFNIDFEMVEKIVQNDDQETTSVEGEKCGEYVKISDENKLEDQENRAKVGNKDREERQAAKNKNAVHVEMESVDGNEREKEVGKANDTGDANNQHKEKKTDDKEEEALQEYKTDKANKVEKTTKDNKLSVEESKAECEKEQEENEKYKSEQLRALEENKAQKGSTTKKENKSSSSSAETKKLEENENPETGNESENSEKSNYGKENLNKTSSSKVYGGESREINNIPEVSKGEIIKPDTKGSTETQNKLRDDESGNRKETQQIKEVNVPLGTFKHSHDFAGEETNRPATELKESLPIDRNKKLITADLVATNNLRQEQNPEASKASQNNDLDDLDHSENQESNAILHYSSSEEMNETIYQIQAKQNKENKSKYGGLGKNRAFSTDIGKKLEHESDDPTKRNENDKTQTETINSTKCDDGSCDQRISEATDARKYSKSLVMLLDYTSTDSMKSAEYQDSTDSETRELKSLCLRRNLKVLLRKLRPCDLTTLRQPKVKVQRTSYEKYLMEFRPKRRRMEEKVYLEFDDSSNSNHSYGANSSSSDAYRPPRVKRKNPVKRHTIRQTRSSDSDNDSNNSDDMKLSAIISKNRKKLSNLPSKRVTGPKSARKKGPKSKRQTTGPRSSKQNLVVTPRSASGLKLRISNAERNRQTTGPASKRPVGIVHGEVIQLSSTSSDECVWNEISDIQEEIIEIDDNPLFEEEIII